MPILKKKVSKGIGEDVLLASVLAYLKSTVKNPVSKAKMKNICKKIFDQLVILFPEFLE